MFVCEGWSEGSGFDPLEVQVLTLRYGQVQVLTLRYGQVQVLTLRYGQVQVLTLFSVPRSCEPLTPHPLADSKEMYPHLSGLELADDLGDNQELQVDILIGSVITGNSSQDKYRGELVDLLQSKHVLDGSFLDRFPHQVRRTHLTIS